MTNASVSHSKVGITATPSNTPTESAVRNADNTISDELAAVSIPNKPPCGGVSDIAGLLDGFRRDLANDFPLP